MSIGAGVTSPTGWLGTDYRLLWQQQPHLGVNQCSEPSSALNRLVKSGRFCQAKESNDSSLPAPILCSPSLFYCLLPLSLITNQMQIDWSQICLLWMHCELRWKICESSPTEKGGLYCVPLSNGWVDCLSKTQVHKFETQNVLKDFLRFSECSFFIESSVGYPIHIICKHYCEF